MSVVILAERAWRCGPADNMIAYGILLVMILAIILVWVKT